MSSLRIIRPGTSDPTLLPRSGSHMHGLPAPAVKPERRRSPRHMDDGAAVRTDPDRENTRTNDGAARTNPTRDLADRETNPSHGRKNARTNCRPARPNPSSKHSAYRETNPRPPSAGQLEQLPPDQHPPDLARPRPDLVQFGVAEQPSGRVVVDVAVATQRLDRLQRHPGRLLGGEHQAAGGVLPGDLAAVGGLAAHV